MEVSNTTLQYSYDMYLQCPHTGTGFAYQFHVNCFHKVPKSIFSISKLYNQRPTFTLSVSRHVSLNHVMTFLACTCANIALSLIARQYLKHHISVLNLFSITSKELNRGLGGGGIMDKWSMAGSLLLKLLLQCFQTLNLLENI